MTKRPLHIPDRAEIADDTPLQLAVAARVAFPDGTMSALGLRNAAGRGELEHERLGGRLYTTLAWIREWRERNRYPALPPNPARSIPPRSDQDSAEQANARAQAALARLKVIDQEKREAAQRARGDDILKARTTAAGERTRRPSKTHVKT